MKLFKLFLFALALSFVAPQAIDAKPRKKARTHKKARRGGCSHNYSDKMNDYPDVIYRCVKCGHVKVVHNAFG